MACRLAGARPLSQPTLEHCWTLGYKLRWNLNRNWYIFIQENAFENVVCKVPGILSRPQCVNNCLIHHTMICRKQLIVLTVSRFFINLVIHHFTSFITIKDYRFRTLQSLRWRHNGHGGVSNHQPHHCLLNLYSGADQRKHQGSASLAFVRGIHRGPVNSPHKWPVTRKKCPFDDVIMSCTQIDDPEPLQEVCKLYLT